MLFGGFVWVGQTISTINYPFATRVGLQESMEGTDPLFQHLEHNTAKWDMVTLWTLFAAGLLMVINSNWWPYLALIAGGVYFDAGGRELVKILGMKAEDQRIGTQRDFLTSILVIYAPMIVVALCVIVAAIYVLARR
jgi:hypothetical protein